MLVRPYWQPRLPKETYDLIRSNPWGLLVTSDHRGPLATNVPWILDRERGEHGVLRSHIARENAQAAGILNQDQTVLAIIEGPYQYITASWYPERSMPSTVYYTAVHCYGRLKLQNETELRAALEDLTQASEARFENGWKTSDIPESEITLRLPAILGFDLFIDRIEAKFKLGQDEPKRDAMAVARHFLASEKESDRSFGRLIERYNRDRTK